jgi:hypothetical protein
MVLLPGDAQLDKTQVQAQPEMDLQIGHSL